MIQMSQHGSLSRRTGLFLLQKRKREISAGYNWYKQKDNVVGHAKVNRYNPQHLMNTWSFVKTNVSEISTLKYNLSFFEKKAT